MSLRSEIEFYAGSVEDITEAELGKALAQAVNLSYQALPDALMHETGFAPIQLYGDSSSVDFSSKTILYVKRHDSNGKERICIEVNPMKWDDYKDPKSIYYATKHNPVYSVKNINNIPVLQVAPEPTGADGSYIDTAYAYWRPTYTNLSSQLDSNFVTNFPQEAHNYVVMTASMLTIGYKLRDIILEEEDSELAQLIQIQMNSLKGQIDSERARLTGEEKGPLNEQSLEQIADPTQGRPTQR